MTIVDPAFAFTTGLIAILVCALLGRVRTNPLPTSRYPTVDGLRGYLAFFVFLHHSVITYFYIKTGEWQVPPSNLFTQLGQGSVSMFFMITAFLFYGKVLDNRNGSIDWFKFYVARIMRLAPLYGIVVVAILVLVLVESDRAHVESGKEIEKGIFKWLSFTIFGAPQLNGVQASRFIAGVNWSLPYEWYFYLVMPLLALTARVRTGAPYLLVGFGAVMLARANGASLFLNTIFLGGIFAALLVRLPAVTRFAKTRHASVIVFVCVAGLVALFPTSYAYPQLVLITLAFTLIVGGSDLFGLLTSSPSRVLGELSYSIYLLHGLLLFVSTKYIIGYEHIRSNSPLAYWGIIFFLVPLLLMVATITFRKVESPSMQLTSRIVDCIRSIDLTSLRDPLVESDNDIDRPVF